VPSKRYRQNQNFPPTVGRRDTDRPSPHEKKDVSPDYGTPLLHFFGLLLCKPRKRAGTKSSSLYFEQVYEDLQVDSVSVTEIAELGIPWLPARSATQKSGKNETQRRRRACATPCLWRLGA